MNNRTDYTLVVASCDNYSDIWNPYFRLLKINWPEFDKHIILICENKSFSFNGLDIEVVNINDKYWSNRLIVALKKVKTKYVLFSLDDFFINDKVDNEEIVFCLNELNKHKDIATFSFADSLVNDVDDGVYQNYDLRHLYGEYRFNTQAALWRKKDLLKVLRKNESAWDAENNGTFRARVLLKNKRFYSVKKTKKLAISYEFGGGLHHGAWTKDTPALFDKYNITGIDFSKRGFDEKPTEEYTKLRYNDYVIRKKTLKEKIIEYLVAKGIKLKKIRKKT